MLATSSTTLWYTTRATGIVALILLTVTMVLGILTAGRVKSRSWPAFAQADLHKRVSFMALVFVTIHVLTSVLDTYVHLGWLSIAVPFVSSYQSLWTGLGTVAIDLMIAVAVSSALRQRISARTWRAFHWLAYGSWPIAMAHSLGEGTDAPKLWMDGIAAACALAIAGALAWRITNFRRAREHGLRVGAITRAVPTRPSSPPSAAPNAPRNGSTAGSPGPGGGPGGQSSVRRRQVSSASRLLEKERP
jgi:sulfoxide reductase heme-binding subunit YedZ